MTMEKFKGKTNEQLNEEITKKQEASAEAQVLFNMETAKNLDEEVDELRAELERRVKEVLTTSEAQMDQITELGGTKEKVNERTVGIDDKIKRVTNEAQEKSEEGTTEKFTDYQKGVINIFLKYGMLPGLNLSKCSKDEIDMYIETAKNTQILRDDPSVINSSLSERTSVISSRYPNMAPNLYFFDGLDRSSEFGRKFGNFYDELIDLEETKY